MRLCLLCSLPLLSACITAPEPQPRVPLVPADLLRPCAGYTGPLPQEEGQLADALLAEAQGRACANTQLGAVAEILHQAAI